MRSVVRAVAALALAVPLLVSGAAPCLACSCVGSPPGQVIADADLVFVGEVTGDRAVGQGTAQRFRVDRVYVGEMPPEVEIYADIGPSMVNSCAVLFSLGEPVALALTRGEDGRYGTTVCDLLSVATVERIAGASHPPDPAAPFPQILPVNAGEGGPWNLPWWAVALMGGILALGLIAISISRTRRRASAERAGPVIPEDVPPPEGHAG